MFKHRDIVQILTTKRIRYLSGPSGQPASPHGNWSIIGFVESDVLISKGKTLVRVPLTDIKKVASLDANSFYERIKDAGFKPSKSELNVAEKLSEDLNIDLEKIRKTLKSHNFKTIVDSEYEYQQILERVKNLGE